MSSPETKTLPINKDQFIQLTSGGKEFFEFVLGVAVPTKKNIKNPFYSDTNAGLSVFLRDGKYFYKDFGDDAYQGDTFSFAGHYYHLNPGTQLHEILERGCQDLGIDYYTPAQNRVRVDMQNSSNGKMHNSHHCPEIVNFKVADNIGDYIYWLQFMDETQLKAALKKHPFRSWIWFEKTKEDTGKKWKIYAKENSPIFAFELIKGELYKIYQPAAPKEFKQTWYPRDAKPEESYNVFGIDQLPDKCEQVLVVEGPKDMIVAAAYGHNVVALDHAGSMPNPKEIESIKQRTDKIVLLLDNDESGVEAAKKLSCLHQWPYLILPESFNIGSNKFEGWGTDIADFFKTADEFSPPFEDVLNELLETQLQGPEPALTPETHKPSVEDYYFWEAQLDKDDNFKQISVSQSILLDLLHHIGGFAKIKLSDNFQYIKKDGRIFKEIKLVEIKDYINGFLDDLAKEDENITDWNGYSMPVAFLREKLIRGSNTYFGAATMENLPTISFNPLRDTKNTAYFYYKNGFVTTTADQITFRPYSELPGDIWEKQILKREITLQYSEKPGEFEQFLRLVTKTDSRYNSMCSYIGFLLHTYRDPSKPQVVVLYDGKESGKPQDYETAQGGTGKGILVNALTELRNSVIIDGKSFRQQNEFPWQRLSVATQLVTFQDVTKNFKFSNLHSVVTDGISVNKKHRPEIFIPFPDSPKFIITTNYIIDTTEDSDRRRIKEIELFPHFSSEHTPQDQFGHLLFNDWNDEEWNKFDNLMIRFIKHYLKDGFIDPPASESAAERKFASRFGQEMLDEFNELQISTTRDRVNGVRHDAKAIREKCTDKDTSLSGGQFAQALKNYCVLAQDIEPPLEFWRSNGHRYFLFYGKKKRDLSNN